MSEKKTINLNDLPKEERLDVVNDNLIAKYKQLAELMNQYNANITMLKLDIDNLEQIKQQLKSKSEQA